MAGDVDDSSLDDRLARVSEHEQSLRVTPLTRFLHLAGPTRPFIAVYRRVGPRLDTWLLRLSRGRAATRVYGMPALLLTTRGARSGIPRDVPLFYVRDGRDFAVTGTNFGQAHHPLWTGNLLAEPAATVEVGGQRIAVTAELADEQTWDRLWLDLARVYPGYDQYLARCLGRKPRVFVLHPVAAA